MRDLLGMEALAAEYEGFIVDLWGVIHDGVTLYDGAADCLDRLRRLGKRVVLLSNAPRRAALVQQQLRRMDLPDGSYCGIVTSGEACRAALIARTDPWFAALGRRLLHIGPRKDRNLFDDLGLEESDDPAQVDFLLNTGPDDDEADGAAFAYDPLLKLAASLRRPMLCANPDLEIVRGGKRIICAGILARSYAHMGGDVRSIGKPKPEVYEQVLPLLAVPRSKILAVGDSLATDMQGAKAADIDACWVLGGIHQEFVGGDPGLARNEAARAGLAPIAIVPRFAW